VKSVPFRSRKLPKLLFSLSAGLAAIGSAQAATYYVRADGGDASQCNGRADAAYPGSGTAQACAWKNPNIALPPSGALRIAGGDTLLIGAGSYQIGSGGYMQPVPSGTSSAPTKVLGKPGTTPKLVGVAGVHRVLNLDGSSNVELGNLEVTDNSDCVYNHSNAAAACTSSMPWARVGLYARASSNVWVHDVNIHGMAKNGMNAGGLSNWTMEHFKLNKNGAAGWDGNIGTGASNSGKMTMRDIEIAWNGCGERVSTGEPWACWAQQAGGYGDGMGTTDTGGDWLIEDAFVHHNTSDGIDLRYMDGADTTKVTLRRIYSVANAGNQVKLKGNSLIENSVLVGNCTYFRGRDFMVDGDLCRAYGSSLLLILTGNDVATVRHNTIAGEGDAQIAYGEGTSTDKIYIQNNLVVGFPYYADTTKQTLFSGGGAPAAKSFSGNMGWKVRTCPTGATCASDPKLTNEALAGFDAEPLAGSPVIDKAPMISAVTTDFVMGARPTGAANDVGAYEYGAGAPAPTPPPVCTRAAPTLTLAGPTNAVAAGTTNSYAVSVKNNDSSACSNTTFALAGSVPSGWTGTLSAPSVALAPGASGSATLAVTSSADAVAGSNAIGVGASSTVGSVHTGNASSTYAVLPPVCTRAAPTLTLTGPTTAVAAGTTNSYAVSVKNNDSSGCSTTTFALAGSVPSGWTGALSAPSVALAPGTSGSATLAVTSSADAAAGSNAIGVGTSSTVGSAHTANASSTYAVAPPVLTETVATSKSSYKAGEVVSMTARVLKNNVAVAGATVSFNALKPNGINTIKLSGTTDANGYAKVSFTSGTGKSSIGTYKLTATATSGSLTTQATSSFTVAK